MISCSYKSVTKIIGQLLN